MDVKVFGIAVAIVVSTLASGAAAQSVTPEQVSKLPVGTKYVGPGRGTPTLKRTTTGFVYSEAGGSITCNNITKAGGHGNATINCTAANKVEFRFEWIDMNSVKAESWKDMAAKAGQKQNKPAQFKATLIRK